MLARRWGVPRSIGVGDSAHVEAARDCADRGPLAFSARLALVIFYGFGGSCVGLDARVARRIAERDTPSIHEIGG